LGRFSLLSLYFLSSDEFYANFRKNSRGIGDSTVSGTSVVACVIAVACVPPVDCVLAVASIPADAGVPLVPDALTIAAYLVLLAFLLLLSSMLLMAFLLLLSFLLLMASLLLLAFLPILESLCYCSRYIYVLYCTMRHIYIKLSTKAIGLSKYRISDWRIRETIVYRISDQGLNLAYYRSSNSNAKSLALQ
jgi:hypothetical protein